jgi:hypothetical protein
MSWKSPSISASASALPTDAFAKAVPVVPERVSSARHERNWPDARGLGDMACVRAIHATRSAALVVLCGLGSAMACSSATPDDEATAGSSSSGGAAGSNHVGGLSNTAGSPTAGSGGTSAGNTAAGSTHAGSSGSASAGRDSSGGSSGDGGGAGGSGDGGAAANDRTRSDYDAAVLADDPVAFWAVNLAPGKELDLTGNGHDGSYRGQGTPTQSKLPNGDAVAVFDGEQQYLSIPSSPGFSIPTTSQLAWEAWIRPDVLQFPNDDGSSGYVDWMGKCEEYGPTCEWEARMYNTNTSESPNRPNRLSAYVFNPGAGLGSGADWQPSAGVIMAGAWYHVVGQYTTLDEPDDCQDTDSAPGSIDIWVNGVKWDHDSHGQTGCMSQYDVVPKANDSAVNIATMAKESFFKGAIGKVAIYDHQLSQAQISRHYTTMTGKQPTGSCGNTCSF